MLNHDVLCVRDPASISRSQERIVDCARAGRGHSRRDGDASIAESNYVRSSEVKSPSLQPHQKVSPQKVLQSFNTWAFKREQPADPHLMLQIISESTADGEPVPFVLYWGKGPRCRLGEPDIECLDYLAALARRVRAAFEPGATFNLIFTDTHAELNGHSQQSMCEYFGAIQVAAGERGFGSCWLGELTRAAEAVATNDLLAETVPEDTLRRLSASAEKWYRGGGTAEQGALKYYQMNMLEKRAVQLAFPRSIFVTFNGSEFRNLFPERLPIFYMYSLRRGVSVKPWFLPSVAPSSGAERADRS